MVLNFCRTQFSYNMEVTVTTQRDILRTKWVNSCKVQHLEMPEKEQVPNVSAGGMIVINSIVLEKY